ncbi:MAG: FHA domain-containing protein, partial [Desulfobacteraceae bacterium]
MEKLYIVRGKYEQLSLGLKDQKTYVGRSPENDIQIQDNYVSRKHLELYKKGDTYFIRDLN